jgi:hypothetical protein
MLLQSRTWARRLTQSPELGFRPWNFVDPSRKFDLIEAAPGLTEVTKIEPAAKKSVDTNNYVRGPFLGFRRMAGR